LTLAILVEEKFPFAKTVRVKITTIGSPSSSHEILDSMQVIIVNILIGKRDRIFIPRYIIQIILVDL